MDMTSENSAIPRKVVEEVRDTCLCFASQRAARTLARRFDQLFAPLGLKNGQYSMMVALAGMQAPKLGELAEFLAMDHTTVTAAMKALERRELVVIGSDAADGRVRRARLTEAGTALLEKAVPMWRAEHARLDAELGQPTAHSLRSGLAEIVANKATE